MELYDCHTHVGVELSHYLTSAFPYCQHFTDLCRDLDAAGIDKVVVFPMVSHLAMSQEAMADGRVEHGPTALSAFPYQFENRRLLEEVYDLFGDHGERAIVLAMFDPTRQTAEQIDSIRELAERYPIGGLKLQGTMLHSFAADLPGSGFLELAAERDWPMLIHSAVHPDDPWAQVSDILDVAESAPSVRFNVAHTLRFDRPQLERADAMENVWVDVSAFCIHCDLATEDAVLVAPKARRFEADYADPGAALRAFAEAYPDTILWGSDAPYYSYAARFTMPDGNVEHYDLRSSMARETAALRALPQALIERIAGSNARAWLFGETP